MIWTHRFELRHFVSMATAATQQSKSFNKQFFLHLPSVVSIRLNVLSAQRALAIFTNARDHPQSTGQSVIEYLCIYFNCYSNGCVPQHCNQNVIRMVNGWAVSFCVYHTFCCAKKLPVLWQTYEDRNTYAAEFVLELYAEFCIWLDSSQSEWDILALEWNSVGLIKYSCE